MTPDEFYASQSPAEPADALRSMWDKPVSIKQFERNQFAELASKKDDGLARAQLSNCYAWSQSKNSVTFVVWIQGGLDETVVEVKEPKHILVKTDGYPAVVDEELAYEIDSERDVDSVSWENLDMIAFKVFKKNPGEVWHRLFARDDYMARAIDFKPHQYCDEDDETISFEIVGANSVSIRRDRLVVDGLPYPYVKHFKWFVDVEASSWKIAENGVSVSISLDQTFCPKKRRHFRKDGTETDEVSDYYADVPDIQLIKRLLFVEEEDGMLTGTVAEMMAYMDYGETRWRHFDSLSMLAQNIFNSLVPPNVRDQYAFEDEDEERDDPEGISEWWRRLHCQILPTDIEEQDDDDEPIVEILSDDEEEDVNQDDAKTAAETPPLAPGGMLGTAPVKIASAKADPRPVKNIGVKKYVEDYAFDSGGSKKVKVYVDFKRPIPNADALSVDFSEQSLSVRFDTLAFEASRLAHQIDPAQSSFKIKQPSTVVLSLKKAQPEVPWGSSLMRDLNAEE